MQGLNRNLREAATHVKESTYQGLAKELKEVEVRRKTALVDEQEESDSDDDEDIFGSTSKAKGKHTI